jgi:hypothetical protein
MVASPDGSVVYVGADFTTVDGAARNGIAAFSAATGALLSGFTANLNSSIRALATTNSAVYVGGSFSTANSVSRGRLAAYAFAGALQGWNPGANSTVYSMTMTPDNARVIGGGGFTRLAGAAAVGMGSVDAASGASRPWAANQALHRYVRLSGRQPRRSAFA